MPTINDNLVYATQTSKPLSSHWYAANRVDPYDRIWVITDGYGELQLEDEIVKLEPGKAYLVPADTVFSYGKSRDLVMYWLHFNLTGGDGRPLTANYKTSNVMPVSDDYMKLVKNVVKFKDADPMQLHMWLCQLLMAFLLEPVKSYELERFEPVFTYIYNNIGKSLKNAELAALVNLEPTYFINLFRKHVGMPPGKYIIRRRLHLVQMHLLDARLSLEEIARITGFYDAYHLSRTFKKYLSITPSEYRRLQ